MSFNFIPYAESPSFSGDTLILPAVSHGNVGQLAVELLINTLGAERAGIIDTRAVVPIVGGGAYDGAPGQLVTAIEVYRCSEHKITMIQQRSPLLKGTTQSFAEDLVQWCSAAGFARVFVLSSANAAFRIDAEIAGTQLGFLGNSESADTEALTAAGFCPLRKAEDMWVTKSSFSSSVIAAAQEASISASVIVSICFEGDNVPNAVSLAGSFGSVLGLTVARTPEEAGVHLKIPPSWKHIQGEPLPAGLQECGMY